MRATPPWARISAGTRSSAITATAPASSAIFACSTFTTSIITPPLSISAMPRFTRAVPVSLDIPTPCLCLASNCTNYSQAIKTLNMKPRSHHKRN